ncbi:unnamed protein product [Aphanomyces euteiches]|uniref:FAD-binding FR-type domain-containing protein n=1 Tax=Aphanomyces euteiches TaxID=100861 RepID=A0A6G0W7S1_9STRA|nr:hypothetical protein Ae201684_017810 [Aphanomyces euteiches]KAH9144526.1 hypothetical protein AeRB84_011522 [Aphanomyces euteiches]
MQSSRKGYALSSLKSTKSLNGLVSEAQFHAESPNKPIYQAFHWIVGALMAFVVIAPIGYHVQFIYRNDLAVQWGPWFNVNPKNTARNAPGKEMLPVAYFFFCGALPIFVAAVAYNLVKSRYRGPTFNWLHIKPLMLWRLVSIGEIIFLTILLAGNVVVFYQAILLQISFKKPMLTCAANAVAFSGLYNMVFLALPATRHSFWMEWLSIPWGRAVKYHRWLGFVTITSFLAHFVFYFVLFAQKNILAAALLPCFSCNLATDGKSAWVNVFGELSLLCMLIMGLTSVSFIRRRYYSTFKAVHFLFIPAMIFAVMHFNEILIWVYASMVLYIVNRMYSGSTTMNPVAIHQAVALADHVTQLTVKCSTTYLPGDVVYVKVPAVSKIQWHPFSIASTPLHTPGLLTVYIKALGTWTTDLYDYVKVCNSANVDPIVYFDTGYTPPPPMSSKYNSVIFVGGGIGVTPLMGQLMHLMHARPNQDIYLIWHVKHLEMAMQFQGWLKEVEDLAENYTGTMHLHIHVTQKHKGLTMPEDPKDGFELPQSTVKPRPYAHISTMRKVLMLFFAFFCSGTLWVYVRYGQKFITLDPAYWPLQYFMEFVSVVVGAYLAYGIGISHPYEGSYAFADDERPQTNSHAMPRDVFVEHYGVKFERADWDQVFQNIAAEKLIGSTPKSIGVYISGPKALGASVARAAACYSLFDLHEEEFDM